MNKKSVEIVVEESGWIVDVLARKCFEELCQQENLYEVSYSNSLASEGKDIYIHFIYLNAKIIRGAINIVYVTHVDRWFKAFRLVRLARENVYFVTMSEDTLKLVKKYTGVEGVFAQVPESIHFKSTQSNRKIHFGIFSLLYPDNRKGNDAIENFLAYSSSQNQNVEITVYGKGWENLLANFPKLKINYYNNDFDIELYTGLLKKCDYVIYFGNDEGAISILDASTLDLPIIAISQGYHSDIRLSRYSKLCQNSDDMLNTLIDIIDQVSVENTYNSWCNIIQDSVTGLNSSPVSLFRLMLIPFIKNKFLIKKNKKQNYGQND